MLWDNPTVPGHALLLAQPRRRGGQVLYLDYDGVLHHEAVYRHPKKGICLSAGPQFTLFQHAPLLSELLQPYPQVRIVLSTSWARILGVKRAASYLPQSLQGRVIGATFHSRMPTLEFSAMPRGQQVYEDYVRRAPSQALALDDVDEGWPASFREHLVLTHEVHGLALAEVRETLENKLFSHFGQGSEEPRAARAHEKTAR